MIARCEDHGDKHYVPFSALKDGRRAYGNLSLNDIHGRDVCSDQFVDVGSLVCSEKCDHSYRAAVEGRICENCLDLLQNSPCLGIVDISLPESASNIHINERRIKALAGMG
jgi:hypothetical protein